MNIPAIERPGWIEPKNAGRFTDNQIISDNVLSLSLRVSIFTVATPISDTSM